MNVQSEIMEGFICPICFKNLGSMSYLLDHFDMSHTDEDRALLNQIKTLFGKAKKKFLDKEDQNSIIYSDKDSSGKIQWELISHEPQVIVCRSHTDFFKSQRDLRINRFSIETNKLLIRLDKLLKIDLNLDTSKRKYQEKSIVCWAHDSDVNICMNCGKSFTLTKRKHHCRLCGCIICKQCSNFMPLQFAKKLTNPDFIYEGEGFQKSNSNNSLNSILSLEDQEDNFRIRTCKECCFLLNRKQEQDNFKNTKPLIVLLYENIRLSMNEVDNLLPEYSKISESLSSGESLYDLEEAHVLRDKLMKLHEQILILVKRVSSHGNELSSELATSVELSRININKVTLNSSKSLKLRQMISAYSTSYLQENLMGLQSLPSRDQLIRLQETRKLQLQKKRADELRKREKEENERKQLERLATQNLNSEQSSPTVRHFHHKRSKSSEGISYSGWLPNDNNINQSQNDSPIKGDIDPLLEQMRNIESYIEQAKKDKRFDEETILKQNLVLLKQEYTKQVMGYSRH